MAKLVKKSAGDRLPADINQILAETKAKLKELHLKKIELIRYYRDLENKKELARIRAKLKQD